MEDFRNEKPNKTEQGKPDVSTMAIVLSSILLAFLIGIYIFVDTDTIREFLDEDSVEVTNQDSAKVTSFDKLGNAVLEDIKNASKIKGDLAKQLHIDSLKIQHEIKRAEDLKMVQRAEYEARKEKEIQQADLYMQRMVAQAKCDVALMKANKHKDAAVAIRKAKQVMYNRLIDKIAQVDTTATFADLLLRYKRELELFKVVVDEE